MELFLVQEILKL